MQAAISLVVAVYGSHVVWPFPLRHFVYASSTRHARTSSGVLANTAPPPRELGLQATSQRRARARSSSFESPPSGCSLCLCDLEMNYIPVGLDTHKRTRLMRVVSLREI